MLILVMQAQVGFMAGNTGSSRNGFGKRQPGAGLFALFT